MRAHISVIGIVLFVIAALAGCQQQGNGADTAASNGAGSSGGESLQTIDEAYQSPGKPILVPVDVKYRLLDTPRVGQPLGLELTLVSSVATGGMSYTLQAENGLALDRARLTESFAGKPAMSPQTTTVLITPQSEGRFYLRVLASIVVSGQSQSRTITIPIQVGAGTRQLETMGEIKTDAEGNPVVSLPAKERHD